MASFKELALEEEKKSFVELALEEEKESFKELALEEGEKSFVEPALKEEKKSFKELALEEEKSPEVLKEKPTLSKFHKTIKGIKSLKGLWNKRGDIVTEETMMKSEGPLSAEEGLVILPFMIEGATGLISEKQLKEAKETGKEKNLVFSKGMMPEIAQFSGKLAQMYGISYVTIGTVSGIQTLLGEWSVIAPSLTRMLGYSLYRGTTWGGGALIDNVGDAIAEDEKFDLDLLKKIGKETSFEFGFGSTIGLIHGIKSIPTKVILGGAGRGVWKTFRELKKDNKIDPEDIKSIAFSAGLGAMIEYFGAKKLQERWNKEDWRRFGRSGFIKKMSAGQKKIVRAFAQAKKAGDAEKMASLSKHMPFLGIGKKRVDLTKVFTGMTREELQPPPQMKVTNKISKSLEDTGLQLTLKYIPTKALALNESNFSKYLQNVSDHLIKNPSTSFIESFNIAAESIPDIDPDSDVVAKNISDKISKIEGNLINARVEFQKKLGFSPDEIGKDIEQTAKQQAKSLGMKTSGTVIDPLPEQAIIEENFKKANVELTPKEVSKIIPVDKYRAKLGAMKEEIKNAQNVPAYLNDQGKWEKGISTYPAWYKTLKAKNKKEAIRYIDKLLNGEKFDKKSLTKIKRFLDAAREEKNRAFKQDLKDKLAKKITDPKKVEKVTDDITDLKDEIAPKEDIVKEMNTKNSVTDEEIVAGIDNNGFDWKRGEWAFNIENIINAGTETITKHVKTLDDLGRWLARYYKLPPDVEYDLRALSVSPENTFNMAKDFWTSGIIPLDWDEATWEKVIDAGERYRKAAPEIYKNKIAKGELPKETEEVLQKLDTIAEWELRNDKARRIFEEGYQEKETRIANDKIKELKKTIIAQETIIKDKTTPIKAKKAAQEVIKNQKEALEYTKAYRDVIKKSIYFPRRVTEVLKDKNIKTYPAKKLNKLTLKMKQFTNRKIPFRALAKELGVKYEHPVKTRVRRSATSFQKWICYDYLNKVKQEGTFIKPDISIENPKDFVDPPPGFKPLFKNQRKYLDEELAMKEPDEPIELYTYGKELKVDRQGRPYINFEYKMDKNFKHGLEQASPNVEKRGAIEKGVDDFQNITKQLWFYNPIHTTIRDIGQSLRFVGHPIPFHLKEYIKAFKTRILKQGRYKELKLAGGYPGKYLAGDYEEKLAEAVIKDFEKMPWMKKFLDEAKKNGLNPLKQLNLFLTPNRKLFSTLHEINLTHIYNYLIDKRGMSVPEAIKKGQMFLGGSDYLSKEARRVARKVFVAPNFKVDAYRCTAEISKHPIKNRKAHLASFLANKGVKYALGLGILGGGAWSLSGLGRFYKEEKKGALQQPREKVISPESGFYWVEREFGRSPFKNVGYSLNFLPKFFFSGAATFGYGTDLKNYKGDTVVTPRGVGSERQRISDFLTYQAKTLVPGEEGIKDLSIPEKAVDIVGLASIYYREPRVDHSHPLWKWTINRLSGKQSLDEIVPQIKYQHYLRKEKEDENYWKDLSPEETRDYLLTLIKNRNITTKNEFFNYVKRKNYTYAERTFKTLSPEDRFNVFLKLDKEDKERFFKFLNPDLKSGLRAVDID